MKGIFHDTRELRDLIIRHPELPLVFHVDSDMSGPDCELHDCAIWTMVEDGEILDCEQPEDSGWFYTHSWEFTQDMEEQVYGRDVDDYEEELNRLIAEYQNHWVPCIVVIAAFD